MNIEMDYYLYTLYFNYASTYRCVLNIITPRRPQYFLNFVTIRNLWITNVQIHVANVKEFRVHAAGTAVETARRES